MLPEGAVFNRFSLKIPVWSYLAGLLADHVIRRVVEGWFVVGHNLITPQPAGTLETGRLTCTVRGRTGISGNPLGQPFRRSAGRFGET